MANGLVANIGQAVAGGLQTAGQIQQFRQQRQLGQQQQQQQALLGQLFSGQVDPGQQQALINQLAAQNPQLAAQAQQVIGQQAEQAQTLAQQQQLGGLQEQILGGITPQTTAQVEGPVLPREQQVAQGLQAQAELAVRQPEKFQELSKSLGLVTQQRKDEAGEFAAKGLQLLQRGDTQGFERLQQQRVRSLIAQNRDPRDTQSLTQLTPEQQIQALQGALVSTLSPERQIELSREPLQNVVEAVGGGFVGIDPRTRKSVFVPAAPGIKSEKEAKKQEEEVKKDVEESKTTFERASKLRSEISKVSTEFNKLNSAFGRIEATVTGDPSAAGDIALIFNFMKMLDPGSVVREGEFATAQQATGVPQRILNQYNKIIEGERLNPKQRTDFLNQSRKIFDRAQSDNEKAINKLVDIGKQFDVSRDQLLGREEEVVQPETEQTQQVGRFRVQVIP